MKGLLLKDWYMMKKYCRSYLLIAAVFLTVSLVNDDNMFFMFYPCLLCGTLPVTLLAYDERSRWTQYSAALPYTKTQIVSEKYLIGLLAQVVALAVTGIVQGIKMTMTGNFALREFSVLMLLFLIITAITSSISLPLVFKLGVEKGRLAYYLMIGFAGGASVWASSFFRGQHMPEAQPYGILALLTAVGIGAYAFSWNLSVAFFQKREVQ